MSTDERKVPLNYAASGVDVDAGDRLVEWLSEAPASMPRSSEIVSGIGGFAAIFQPDFSRWKSPCLVAATDGIGTKVKIAAEFGRYREVGQDLVAMCVNDLVCCGAEPLFFLDYYASGKLDIGAAQEFLIGVREACRKTSCALIGGETAEMPGVYQQRDFDAAGFAVGIVERDGRLGPERVSTGARVIGVSSSGFHSNGYSLLRKVFAGDLEKWIDRLIVPTNLYVHLVLELYRENLVQAAAHITGGGMENVPRVLPSGTRFKLMDWSWPDEFIEVQDRTDLSRTEMLKTLNCGVGMALIVAPAHVEAVCGRVAAHGFRAIDIGSIEEAVDGSGAEARVDYGE